MFRVRYDPSEGFERRGGVTGGMFSRLALAALVRACAETRDPLGAVAVRPTRGLGGFVGGERSLNSGSVSG